MGAPHQAISLFAGAGGLDIGVDRARIKTICSIELDRHCAATLRRNARRKTVWQVDIRALDPQRVLDVLDLEREAITLLHGGPPCQPFSQIGHRRGLDDPRGSLVFEMARFAKTIRPTTVMMEQVPAFLRARTADGQPLLECLRTAFSGLGYDLHVRVLDALHHGLAQRRRRAFIVGVPKGQAFAFPDPPPGPTSTVGHAIDDLPQPTAKGEEPALPNHTDVTPARDRERIRYVPEGLWLSKVPDVPSNILRNLTRKDTTKFRRLHRGLPAPTVRCGEPFYHPIEPRYITPRETARLQGFPDHHVLLGPIRGRTGQVPDLDQHRQVANAVPPPMATAVARSIGASLCLT